ncbi:acylphosphatase [uncultured Georgenia sp.]|mgnify:CR=1 FL=1|uniref:acylphosphatase n=1 Tax=uncultured Georgenia sp. TaxID=378209 RepID=UPI00262A9FD9|nr:acylphosphatase [uncultured Georgenia sp.]HLV04231.1 acylphosphatase [Actinomycetaceae bacterium]
MQRCYVTVSGRVQGVGMRWACATQAERAGVAGWVRNLSDGRVEVVLEGEDDAVAQVLSWLHTGPPGARVDDVTVRTEEPVGEQGFRIR